MFLRFDDSSTFAHSSARSRLVNSQTYWQMIVIVVIVTIIVIIFVIIVEVIVVISSING